MSTSRKRTVFILAALIVLAMGVAMLGNTFATGLKLSGSEEAAGGHYAVDFKYFDREAGAYRAVPQKPADPNQPLESAVTKGMFWCPGRTEIIYLKIANQEQFPIRGAISVNVTGDGFGKTLTYAVIQGDAHKAHPDNWKDYLDKASQKDILEAGKGYSLHQQDLVPGEESYIALAIHMDESASNKYQNNTMNVEFALRVDADYNPGETPTD